MPVRLLPTRRQAARSGAFRHDNAPNMVPAIARNQISARITSYNVCYTKLLRASGLWQFIPSTGKRYNLDQDWWKDERRDIVASTAAALDYLQSIYEMHGDWHLALASYNWGEGAVGRAIGKNRAQGLPTDYLSLTMPQETRNYVPKLQALKNIFIV